MRSNVSKFSEGRRRGIARKHALDVVKFSEKALGPLSPADRAKRLRQAEAMADDASDEELEVMQGDETPLEEREELCRRWYETMRAAADPGMAKAMPSLEALLKRAPDMEESELRQMREDLERQEGEAAAAAKMRERRGGRR